MRTFYLERREDVSGVSGTGRVAEGVEFSTGRVAMQWRGPTRSLVYYDSMTELEAIHGHDGRTQVVWCGTADAVTCDLCGHRFSEADRAAMCAAFSPAVRQMQHPTAVN